MGFGEDPPLGAESGGAHLLGAGCRRGFAPASPHSCTRRAGRGLPVGETGGHMGEERRAPPRPGCWGPALLSTGGKIWCVRKPLPPTISLAPLDQLEHLPVALRAIPPPACPLPGCPPFVLKLSPHPLLGCDACPSHSQPRWVHPPLLGDTSSRKPSLSPSPTPVQDHSPGGHPRVPPGWNWHLCHHFRSVPRVSQVTGPLENRDLPGTVPGIQ